MKRILFVVLLAMSVLFFGGCFSKKLPSAMLAQKFTSLESLAKASPLVVSCKVNGKSQEFTYKEVDFAKTEVLVKEIYRNDVNIKNGDKITILQTLIQEDPLIDKNDELLLFLEKYEGPVCSDAYQIVGAVQGHYKIKDGKIYSKADKKFEIAKNLSAGTDIKELSTILDKEKFTKKASKKVKSAEDINKENDEEKASKIEFDEKSKSNK